MFYIKINRCSDSLWLVTRVTDKLTFLVHGSWTVFDSLYNKPSFIKRTWSIFWKLFSSFTKGCFVTNVLFKFFSKKSFRKRRKYSISDFNNYTRNTLHELKFPWNMGKFFPPFQYTWKALMPYIYIRQTIRCRYRLRKTFL